MASRWDFLGGIEELAHHSIIAGYVRRLGSGKCILDVGCGTGTLQEILRGDSYQHYTGIDISAEAVQRASARQDARTFFVCSDVTEFTPDRAFDVIVFNECLYYLRDPVMVLKKCAAFINKGGVFIISMYAETQTRLVWNMIAAEFGIYDETHVTNRAGTSWTIKVMRPH